MISLEQLKPERFDFAWNKSSKKGHLFALTFAENFLCCGKVTGAHGIGKREDGHLGVMFCRRRNSLVGSTDTVQICLLCKGGRRFEKLKQWLIGYKFDQAIQDPFIVSIASKRPIVAKQCSKKLRVSRIQSYRSF